MKVGSIPLTPIWREGLLGLELGVAPAPRRLPRPAAGAAVAAGDAGPGLPHGRRPAWARLASWLRRCGHRTHTSGIRLNVDCSAAAIGRLEQRLEAFVAREGEPAVVIGQSRGGLFARVLAVRRPDLVHSIVTLGSPHLDPLAVHPLVWVQGAAIAGARRAGRARAREPPLPQRRLLRRSSRQDLAAADARRACGSSRSTPRRDGIVDWPACLDPHAVHVEVRSTHCGMGVNPAVYELLDSELHASAAAAAARAFGRRAAAPRGAGGAL